MLICVLIAAFTAVIHRTGNMATALSTAKLVQDVSSDHRGEVKTVMFVLVTDYFSLMIYNILCLVCEGGLCKFSFNYVPTFKNFS